eukprot:TRINITY_DN7906_c0_g1_i1.p1 TRINITY_DN7906_c0_g1~~TRINITY_DN7906_c0_g1_i1.p1  ORF type:complete len:142 (+),score=27.76 TRINITY_DN7906_c0_g1_i1:495-920(+)
MIIVTLALCCPLDVNNAGKKIATGFNSYRPSTSCKIGTIHAEIDAVQKLKPKNDVRRRGRNYIKLDMLIIRCVNRSNNNNVDDDDEAPCMNMSRPCKECVKSLNKLPKTKGYIIDRVFYSDEHGGITCQKFADMVTEVLLK